MYVANTYLARGLILDIEIEETEGEEVLVLTLSKDDLLTEPVICRYTVSTNTSNRPYHRREAAVIAMRQLVSQAFKEGMISSSLGVSTTLSNDWASS